MTKGKDDMNNLEYNFLDCFIGGNINQIQRSDVDVDQSNSTLLLPETNQDNSRQNSINRVKGEEDKDLENKDLDRTKERLEDINQENCCNQDSNQQNDCAGIDTYNNG